MDNILWFPFMATFGVLAIIVAVLLFIFWLWMIIDCAKRKFINSAEKIIWILVIVFATWIGSLVYYIVIPLNSPKGIFKRA